MEWRIQGGGNHIIQKQTSWKAWHNQGMIRNSVSVCLEGACLGELEEEVTPDRTGMDCKGPEDDVVCVLCLPTPVGHWDFTEHLKKALTFTFGLRKMVQVRTEVEMDREKLDSYRTNWKLHRRRLT